MIAGQLRRSGPMTGLGYFTVERSTLTAQLSVTLTYVIVLMQMPGNSDG